MASARTPPLASSEETTNGWKLTKLLIDGGTLVLRDLFDQIHPPRTLRKSLDSHKTTLEELFYKRVLDTSQWEIVFPRSGAPPADSRNFDISLLFLLLTNICGLSPPRTGWHQKPQKKDRSREANLARIKFYRNKVIAHRTTTAIDATTFTDLWKEISAALHSLGLPQTYINRLKAERYVVEDDHIALLIKWKESEENIKSQLQRIDHAQTNLQKTVDGVRQTQLQDHETIQENTRKLEEVHQLQEDLQKTVDDVNQSQLSGHEGLQENKAKLEDMHLTQLEGNRILHESQTMLGEVRDNVKDLKGEREGLKGEEVLSKLAKIDSFSDIRRHANRYVQGTRLPIFEEIERWLDDIGSPNRVMVISGNAGMGKSVISAVFCEKMLKAGRLSGCHFCQHNKARRRNPKVMLQSLACQLCDSLPEYRKTLVKNLSRNLGVDINDMEVGDLFELLFEESLEGLDDPGSIHLLVIDGLDESEYQGRNELLNLIADYFRTLPRWIRIVVTTRPEMNISEKLQELNPIELKPDDRENLKDIRLCFQENLEHILQSDFSETVLEKLVEKSEGVMLYTYYLTEFVKKNATRMSIAEVINSGLPSGVSSVYQDYFKRLQTDLQKEVGITEEQFFDFLNAIVAAREPLPVDFACKLFLSKEWSSADEQKVRDAMDCISALLPIEGECINFFHKSVKDWLTEKSTSRQKKFTVNERECQRVIAKLCTDELDSLKRKGIPRSGLKQTSRYALQHGVQHILEVEKNARPYCLDDIVRHYVLNIELTYAKLSVRSTATTEDILCVQEKEDINALSKDYRRALETLLFLLRKHVSILSQVPHVIFQTLLNEGGPELSAEALSLLNTRYADLPYMEYLQKKEEGEADLMRFYTSDKVVCFDVSPDLHYLVCECKDGTIHLWSLRTAQLLWKRAVQVPKIYKEDPDEDEWDYSRGLPKYNFDVYRNKEYSDTLSFYRSVVFHPTLNLILPGILCQAHTLAGDLKPLFLTSKCRFNLCSISGDKTTMLTDCPNRKKVVTQWSLKDGTEITRFSHEHDILSFAWSPSGRLMAIADCARCIYLINTHDGLKTLIRADTPTNCGMLKLSPDCRFLFGLCCEIAENEIVPNCQNMCLDIERDTESVYNFSQFYQMTSLSQYVLAFQTCNASGFLSGDPFWCTLALRFGGYPKFALVLNNGLFIEASPFSDEIDVSWLNDARKGRGESSDESEQGTDLGDLTEQRGENNDLTEQKAEFAGLPEEVELVDLDNPLEIDDIQKRKTDNDVLSGRRAEVVDPLEPRAKLDDLPEQRAEHGGLVEHGAKLNNITEKRDELDDVVVQRTEFNDPPEKNIELLNSMEVGVKLVEPPVILEIDPLVLSENGADLYDFSEKNSIVPDQHELDDSDELLLHELDLLDDVERQGPLLEDIEKSDVVDHFFGKEVYFSIDGGSLYLVKARTILGINLRTGDIFTKRFKGERRPFGMPGFVFVPVKRGVLFKRDRKSLELWNSELSVCIQRWPTFDAAFHIVPLSEERVAIKALSSFSQNLKVTVLDTTSGKIVSIIGNFDGTFLACNSKCEVLTYTDGDSMQLRCENRVLWETSLHPDLQDLDDSAIFSPTEEYFIISGKTDSYVFDVVSGKVISQLKDTNVASTTFISNEDCIAGVRASYPSGHYFLRLYNVKSGDLLCEIVEERGVSSFAACPCKRLVVVGLRDSEYYFEIIKVKLPGDNEKKSDKRLIFPKH